MKLDLLLLFGASSGTMYLVEMHGTVVLVEPNMQITEADGSSLLTWGELVGAHAQPNPARMHNVNTTP
jgi:hypothetical protein